MPEDTPPVKLAATRGYGAEVITYDRYHEDRERLGGELAERRGLTLVPPYEHPLVMAGQGTATLELLEDAGELDALLVPVGGGGLLAGSATAAKGLLPGISVIGVEPEAGDDTPLAGRRPAGRDRGAAHDRRRPAGADARVRRRSRSTASAPTRSSWCPTPRSWRRCGSPSTA